ncbi:MAG: hypothetical protein Q7R73_00760 [bacterium]|nr:hypothetical protein [bacterium]
MEDIIFQIYGTFVLTLASFVLPIIAIALSAFPDGVKTLKQTYANEQKQAEKNLSDELEKKEKSEKNLDYDLLEKNIRTLKLTKKKTEKRLSYLNPNYILSKSVIAIGISIISFLLGLLFYNLSSYIIPSFLFLLSIGTMVWMIIIFSNSIKIVIEASSAVQEIRKTTEETIIELLATLVDNSKSKDRSLFIEHKHISTSFNNEEVKEGKEYSFSINKKYKIKISLTNSSEYMLKTAELGFTFPAEFLVEGTTISRTYTGDKEKIIRFEHDHLQSKERMQEGAIDMTFLKMGVFDIETFVKGENLKRKTIKFKIKVIE